MTGQKLLLLVVEVVEIVVVLCWGGTSNGVEVTVVVVLCEGGSSIPKTHIWNPGFSFMQDSIVKVAGRSNLSTE